MSLFDDDRPKKIPAHEIGCELAMLSKDELGARILLLKEEIHRLEHELLKKDLGKSAAENLFKR
jgi:uncharacterized small protein (DUF1192 family)